MDCGCVSHNGFLTAKGLKEAAQREVDSHGLDAMWSIGYLDSRGSVSAVENENEPCVWDDQVIDSQYRRFLSGVDI